MTGIASNSLPTFLLVHSSFSRSVHRPSETGSLLFVMKYSAFAPTSIPPANKSSWSFSPLQKLTSKMMRFVPKGCTAAAGSFVSNVPLAIPTPYRNKNSRSAQWLPLSLAAVQDGSRFPSSPWQRHESTSESPMASKTSAPECKHAIQAEKTPGLHSSFSLLLFPSLRRIPSSPWNAILHQESNRCVGGGRRDRHTQANGGVGKMDTTVLLRASVV